MDCLTALMSQFVRVVLAHRVAGRDPLFPNANKGIVYMKMAIDEGTSFSDFIPVETIDGVVDSIVRVFTDNSLKRCYRCGQLGHIGAFCRRAAKSIADQRMCGQGFSSNLHSSDSTPASSGHQGALR